MDTNSPFKPAGPTFALAATPNANPPATLVGGSLVGDCTYRFWNSGSADALLAYGPSSTGVSTNAVAPALSGVGTQLLSVAHGETRGFTLPGGMFFAAVTITGSSTIYATAGLGIV